ncbi:cytochrome b [Chryseobacterium sp. WG14]|uniref:cytochrome b n=1 Tax=unclassified Chryseobacterium TaxID=2593645 RepID=UPI00211DFAA0|nr:MULTISPECIES: cytochrome b [unclassified Chryseobacterium]MCQ9636358.1 cytochrome b [Chryseobacterium sp. WG23]MCQ9641522.1 cytochrome b [Chryseobacterium sp. WG14]
MVQRKSPKPQTIVHFNIVARILHWLMATMILSTIFIGLGMMTSLDSRPWLIDLHIPIGVAIFVLCVLRLINRIANPIPELPDEMPKFEKKLAHCIHWVMYALMIALPLTGWAQLSAGGFQVKLSPTIILPEILNQSPLLYAWLHDIHRVLAWLLFFIVVGHLSIAFLHALVIKDGIFSSMTWGGRKIKK